MSSSKTKIQYTALLSRILSLRDNSPFILCVDSLLQSRQSMLALFWPKIPETTNVIFLAFETPKPLAPKRVNHFIPACDFLDSQDSIRLDSIAQYVSSLIDNSKKNLLIIDSFSFIPTDQLTAFLACLMSPYLQVLGVFHSFSPDATLTRNPYYPSAYTLLSYIATTVLEARRKPQADEVAEEEITRAAELLVLPTHNVAEFHLSLTQKRKSGRRTSCEFVVNGTTCSYELLLQEAAPAVAETAELLKGLTTFNLVTSDRQKLAKENVELPYLSAQEFEQGGAIVYQYEKDDDYDEEDPYEDPF